MVVLCCNLSKLNKKRSDINHVHSSPSQKPHQTVIPARSCLSVHMFTHTAGCTVSLYNVDITVYNHSGLRYKVQREQTPRTASPPDHFVYTLTARQKVLAKCRKEFKHDPSESHKSCKWVHPFISAFRNGLHSVKCIKQACAEEEEWPLPKRYIHINSFTPS